MDSSSFCIAGKRAFHILSTNSLRVFAINSIGDFVLLLGKVFVVLATVLIGIDLIQVTFIHFKFYPHKIA
jgi:solute carrier family 44 (choline transporter-like protein), member 1